MADQRTIKNVPKQNLYGAPQVRFRPNDFSAAIWTHSYDAIIETAVRCPCQGTSGAPHPDCQNCHGFGYFFINQFRTKALITGLNRSTENLQWSPELIGTAAITLRAEDRDLMAYFNRVTLEHEYAIFTEMILTRKMTNGDVAAFLTYAPIEVQSVWVYDGPDSPLKQLDKSEYGVSQDNPYCIQFQAGVIAENTSFSILYKHRVEYHIIDLPHEVRASAGKNKKSGAIERLEMPVQGIGRRTHLIDMRRPNYDGSGVIHNDDF